MCKEMAKYRFTWPGDNESLICEKHVGQLNALADAMGFHLQIISLSEKDLELNLICHQEGD